MGRALRRCNIAPERRGGKSAGPHELPRPGDGRTRQLHRKALGIALAVAATTAIIQPFSGDRSAKHVAAAQPVKLAALEAHVHTGGHAPLHVGGVPDLGTGEFHGALAIPGGLSFLAHGDFDATVTGLDAFPRKPV